MTTSADTDAAHLARTIELAERGRGHVNPNPLVGALLVKDGDVVGEGHHAHFGGPHAEREAIAAARCDLHGATLYVSLEPCCHHGQTPPCTEAIVAAGIARVVVASDDPTEKASGRGLGILRDEGIEVEMAGGELPARARLINQPFRKHARTGRPHVRFKSAMTLDGKVATETGHSKWISGPLSRGLAHQWRAQADAVAVGIGTALADDPQLTARPASFPEREGADGPDVTEQERDRGVRQPKCVVFDSMARLPVSSKLVEQAPQVPLIVVASRAAPRTATEALESSGATVVIATGENESARVASGVEQLGAAGITALLLEGGPRLAGAFLDAGEIDEVCLFLAPLLLGGRGARMPVEGEGVEAVSEAVRALNLSCESIGEDLLVRARLREW